MIGRKQLPDFSWVRQLTWPTIRTELYAGATGAAVVLPQAVAFATIAGLPPHYGIYSAIIPPVIATLLGSSVIMVSGPSTAMSAIVFSALAGTSLPSSEDYVRNAILMALFVGLIQLALSWLRAGRISSFVSPSVMTGFTASAAVLIAVSQIAPALGFRANATSLLHRVEILADQIVHQTNTAAVTVSVVALLIVIFFRKWLPNWPGFLIALAAAAFIAGLLGGEASGLIMVDRIPAALPDWALPQSGNVPLLDLFRRSFPVAMIGLLSSIAIGRTMAQRSGTSFSADREIFAQGVSNVVGSFFQSYPCSGSFTRSAVNYECRASTPLSSIFSAFFLALLAMIAQPYIGYVPVAAIAGIVLYVAWRLIDMNEILRLARGDRVELSVVAVTFFAGLLESLETAVYVGVAVSVIVFLSRSSHPSLTEVAPVTAGDTRSFTEILPDKKCPAIKILRIDGPLFFGSSDALENSLDEHRAASINPGILVLLLKGVSEIDMSASEVLKREAEKRSSFGQVLVVASSQALRARLERLAIRSGLEVYSQTSKAITKAVSVAAGQHCGRCVLNVFNECESARRNLCISQIG